MGAPVAVLTGVLAKAPDLDPARIGDVVWGNANGAGEDNRNVGRMAVLRDPTGARFAVIDQTQAGEYGTAANYDPYED